MTELVRAEFHCHSSRSSDGWPDPRAFIDAARRKGIQRLAVTDHNSISAAQEAKRLAPELIIVGEEIKTTVGEFLAYFVTREIPRGLEPMEVISRLKDQGAFISLSHPFDVVREHWPEDMIRELLPHLDAMEVFNARCFTDRPNRLAQNFAEMNDIPQLAGSDAHTIMEIGKATMQLPCFNNSEELRAALKQSTMQTRLSPFWVHLFSWSRSLSRKVFRATTRWPSDGD